MTDDRVHFDYWQKRTALAQAFGARSRDLYGRYAEQLEAAGAPAGERLQQTAMSWQKTLSELGNGDDTLQRAQAAWLDHQRQYADAVDAYRQAAGEAARQLGDDLATAQRDAFDQARRQYAEYLSTLQAMLQGKPAARR